MEDFEGSANLEGFDDSIEESGETTSEDINNSENESTDESEKETEESSETKEESDESNDEEEAGDKKVEYTDKGTKKDPNPESAMHQELANARSAMKEYQELMSDPKALKRYISNLEEELGDETGESKADIKERAEEENLITDPSKIKTPEDFQSYVKFLTKDFTQAKEDLIKEKNAIRQESSERAINERLVSEIDKLQNTYSFLNPTKADGTPNPDFDAELEKEISEQFDELDKDSKTGRYLGKVSITKIAERAIRIRKLGEATGSKNAHTNVLDKRHGAVKSGGTASGNSDESKMTATQIIASRIRNARGNR